MTDFFLSAICLICWCIDHIVPMKRVSGRLFVDVDNNRPVYYFEEFVSGRIVMAHHCYGVHRVEKGVE